MDNKRIHTLLTDFIPIFLIFCFATLPKETVLFSKTILGKLVAISIILYYTQKKFVYGLFVCSVILFYYQSELVENILNQDRQHSLYESSVVPWNVSINDSTVSPNVPLETFSEEEPQPEEMCSGVLPFDRASSEPFSYTPFISFNSQNEDILRGKGKKEELQNVFRKQVCIGGIPHWKGQPVRTEMADHVFREIEMGDNKCNPCNPDCDFDIIEERLTSEENLVRPKSSKESSDWGWDGLQNMVHSAVSLPHLFAEHWGELQHLLVA